MVYHCAIELFLLYILIIIVNYNTLIIENTHATRIVYFFKVKYALVLQFIKKNCILQLPLPLPTISPFPGVILLTSGSQPGQFLPPTSPEHLSMSGDLFDYNWIRGKDATGISSVEVRDAA